MRLIVGLGNPGKEYDKTRHNIGFNVLDIIADKYNLSFNENKKFNALEVIFNIMNEKIILIKPLTFMNLSGDCVVKYVDYYNIDINDILVIHDDLDMELGKIRIVYDKVGNLLEDFVHCDIARLKQIYNSMNKKNDL